MADKTAAEKKSGKKMEKGDAYLCEICGLQVNVEMCAERL